MIAVIVGAMLLSGGSFHTSQVPDASTLARDALNKGVSAFRNGDYESAVAFLTQAVQIDPNMSVAELYLATAYAQRYVPELRTRENLAFADNAIALFKGLLNRNPNDANALLGLATIYRTRRTNAAIPHTTPGGNGVTGFAPPPPPLPPGR